MDKGAVGYSPRGLERVRHDLATKKQQSETYLSCLEQGGSEGEFILHEHEFLTVPKEQPTGSAGG